MTMDPHADIDAALSELLAPDTASFRPSTWSDTHTAPPQVADLADEAWEYALDHGCSMEQALKALQDRDDYDRRYITGSGTGHPVGIRSDFTVIDEFWDLAHADMERSLDAYKIKLDSEPLLDEWKQAIEPDDEDP